MTLSLAYPANPYRITQSWGVPNDAYIPFGFSRHNGIDFAVDTDGVVQAMCNGTVTQVGYQPTGAGNFVCYRTDPVEAEGTPCVVEFTYMHAKEILVKVGDKVTTGTNLIIADNTGFSTGPHTHIRARRYDVNQRVILDTDASVNYSFDHSKYFNGQYADGIFRHTFNTDMEVGNSSQEVRQLQKALQIIGYFPQDQKLTGYYGSITQSAVFNFQRDYVAKLSPRAWIAVWSGWGKYCASLTRGVLNQMFSG